MGTEIIRWLDSDEGIAWSLGRHQMATRHHRWIELRNDVENHGFDSRLTATQQFYAHKREPLWFDIRWDPDFPPERVLPAAAGGAPPIPFPTSGGYVKLGGMGGARYAATPVRHPTVRKEKTDAPVREQPLADV